MMKKKLLFGALLLTSGHFAMAQQVTKLNTNVDAVKSNKSTNVHSKALGEVVWHDDFTNMLSGPGLATSEPSNWTASPSVTDPKKGWTTDAVYNGWWMTGTGAGVFASTSGGNFAELSNYTTTPSGSNHGNPEMGTTFTLTSPVINILALAGSNNAILSFEQDGATFNDEQEVQISTDGTNWTTIYNNFDVKEGQERFGSSTAADLIELDLTDVIASSPTTVQIRFSWTTAFPNEPTNPWAWFTYGWLIDDVKITQKPDFDLVSTYNFHHTEMYQYSQIPVTQIAPIVFRAGIKNQGAEPLTNVVYTINDGTTPTTSNTLATFAAGAVDTLEATYTPTGVGNYTITGALSMDQTDDKPNNNVIPSVNFSVGQNIYAVDKGTNFTQFPLTSLSVGGTPVVISGVGTSYDIVNDQDLYAVDFRFFTGTALNSTVYAELYEFNPSASAWSEYWTYLDETAEFELTTSSQISQIQTLQFASPYTLEAGKTYLVLLTLSSGTIQIAASGTTETAQAWIKGNHTNVWGNFSGIPVVRMNFDASLGLNENQSINEVKLFPNPATDNTVVEFNLDNASDISVQVIDVTGKVVETISLTNASAGKNTAELNVASLATGIYSVEIKSNESSITKKLVVR